MVHSLLARAAWIFVGLAAVATLAFAAMVDRAPVPASIAPGVRDAAPDELFAQHCALCHEAEAMAASLRAKPDRQGTRREAVDFLRGHGEASGEEDARIVDFLLGGPAPAHAPEGTAS